MRLIKEIMTREVEVVHPDAPLEQAAQKMRKMDIGSLPVCDGERLLGMITDRDITVRATAEARDPLRTAVREMMTPEVVYCLEDENVAYAARLMEDHKIRRLPIINRDKRLVGIISLGEVAYHAAHDVQRAEEEIAAMALAHISEPARAGG